MPGGVLEEACSSFPLQLGRFWLSPVSLLICHMLSSFFPSSSLYDLFGKAKVHQMRSFFLHLIPHQGQMTCLKHPALHHQHLKVPESGPYCSASRVEFVIVLTTSQVVCHLTTCERPGTSWVLHSDRTRASAGKPLDLHIFCGCFGPYLPLWHRICFVKNQNSLHKRWGKILTLSLKWF